MDEDGAAELEDQRLLIEEILAGKKTLRRRHPPGSFGFLPAEFDESPALGRNDLSFCESGIKYKQCCGRHDS
jgi:uncharacterized protein YecA (UPF0149 family)